MAEGNYHRRLYSCNTCFNPVALSDDLLSKAYKAMSGRAFLFRHAMNVRTGNKVDRQLLTGRFTVANIYCAKCGEVLGWKYIQSHDPMQAYKEGKYFMERAKLVKE